MRINDKNKRRAYNAFMTRSGIGFSYKYAARKIPTEAKDHMNHKPYGEMYEQKHPDTAE